MNYRDTRSPIAREAWLFALPAFGASLLLGFLGLKIASAVLLVVFAYIVFFFRNPQRQTPGGADTVIAPADGKVVAAGIVPAADFPDGQALRIGIFMSLFNVHMNWAPASGTVTSAHYHPGRFLNAMDNKSAEENERKILELVTVSGRPFVVKLVAGLVARRIVSPIAPGDRLQRGEKIGLIRFGSRVEMLLPADSQLEVAVGARVYGGQTVIARMPGETAAPQSGSDAS